jgi:predicted nucleotidyltransferase
MSNRHGLSDETVAKIREVLARFQEVEKAVLYGSRAKGNATPGSDIDLTLIGSNLDQRIVGQIDDALDDLLLPYRFDISIFARISHTDLLDHIRQVGVAFYERAPVEAKR